MRSLSLQGLSRKYHEQDPHRAFTHRLFTKHPSLSFPSSFGVFSTGACCFPLFLEVLAMSYCPVTGQATDPPSFQGLSFDNVHNPFSPRYSPNGSFGIWAPPIVIPPGRFCTWACPQLQVSVYPLQLFDPFQKWAYLPIPPVVLFIPFSLTVESSPPSLPWPLDVALEPRFPASLSKPPYRSTLETALEG